MSKRQENSIRMISAVLDVFEKYEFIWKKDQGFSNEVVESRALMTALETSRIEAEQKSEGITITKNATREEVIKSAIALSKRTCVYLRKAKELDALKQLKVNSSDLKIMADNALVAKLFDMHKQMNAFIKEIGLYNVSPQNLSEFKNLIEKFKALAPKPRGLQVSSKEHNRTINALIKKIKDVFVNTDDLISGIEEEHFEHEYKDARQIIERGNRHNKKDDDPETDDTKDKKEE